MAPPDFDAALAEAQGSIKEAIGRLKAGAAGHDPVAWKSAPCLPGCIKCDSSCIARSACDSFGCANTCITFAEL